MVIVRKILINSNGKFIILDYFLLLLLKLYFMHWLCIIRLIIES